MNEGGNFLAFPVLAVIVLFVLILLVNMLKILREYERGVIFRLGRLIGAKGPGLIILIPIVDKMVRVDLRTITYDVPPQDVITRDNVSVKVNAVVYFQVIDANKAIISVANFFEATSQIAQTTLRSVLGQLELDDLLMNRDKINAQLADDHRCPDRAVGCEGVGGGGEECRLHAGDDARDGSSGGGRARTSFEDHSCRG